MDKIYEAAMEYLSFGWSIMPLIKKTKNPSIKWKELQNRLLTSDEAKRYFNNTEVGIGLICGQLSGIVVIDLDLYKEHAKIINLDTPVKVRTGGGGLHGYFKYKPGTRNKVNTELAADIRGEGGYVVLPPSIHPNGNQYKWEIAEGLTLKDAISQIPELSEELLEWMSKNHLTEQEGFGKKFDITSAVALGEGSRNDTLYRASCSLLTKYSPREAYFIVENINKTYFPPLPDNEVETLFQSASDFISNIQEKTSPVSNVKILNYPLKPISISELMNKKFSNIQWVVEQLIPAEAIVAISGLPSAYKTWITLCLAVEVAKGGVLFSKFATTKTGVLIIDEETGERWMQQRIFKLQCATDLPIYLLSGTGFKLTEATVKQLLSFVREKEIGFIIFDSLVRIHTARDENDAVEMAKVFSLFKKLNLNGITIAFTHHNRKPGLLRSSNPSQDMRGSSDILAAVDCHLAIERKDETVTITQTKLRQGQETRPFKLNIINDDTELRFEFAGEVEEDQTKKADWKEAIKDYLSEQGVSKYKKEMFDNLKGVGVEGGYSTFKTTVKEMVDKGELFERRGEKNKVFCSLRPFDEQILIEESVNSDG